jgi:acyl-CoA reductase-like NAD-dependent aldehyde dehydrogenase
VDDADLDAAVGNLVDGAMFNSGQCCCGIERIYVAESLYDASSTASSMGLTSQYKLGNPLDEETTLGPMAQARFADWCANRREEALRKGAKAHIDLDEFPKTAGRLSDAAGADDVNHQMSVMREESFGPVVGIMKVRDDEEALQFMNDSPYGLTASLWTEMPNAAAQIGDRSRPARCS